MTASYTVDNIIALSTPPGSGALAVIRLSGPRVIEIVDSVFFGQNLGQAAGGTVHYGKIRSAGGEVIDECMAAVFRSPRSYTREDCVELSCHGSTYIVQRVIELLCKDEVRLAEPGEFTMRAYLNGQMDLSQAEAVADLIASRSQEQHQMAMRQMRGGVTKAVAELREQLLRFASLIELENDFGEEDVEFADRQELVDLAITVQHTVAQLRSSFRYGQAIKEGVPVAIVGPPNVGKSTLLNCILQEDRAIVSDIPGTTRDVIEDTVNIDGILFRFMDTAGLREASDSIEKIGIKRSYQKLEDASLVVVVLEISAEASQLAKSVLALPLRPEQGRVVFLNKSDTFHTCHSYDVEEAVSTLLGRTSVVAGSAKGSHGVDQLLSHLVGQVRKWNLTSGGSVISNARHHQALERAHHSMAKVLQGLEAGLSSDLVALDIRHTLHHLGEITGEISTDDLLGKIFSDFCIGK